MPTYNPLPCDEHSMSTLQVGALDADRRDEADSGGRRLFITLLHICSLKNIHSHVWMMMVVMMMMIPGRVVMVRAMIVMMFKMMRVMIKVMMMI